MEAEKLYTKEDYATYCEHEDDLVRNWGFEHLTKLHPEAEVTVDYLFKFIKQVEQDQSLKYIIRNYLRENYHHLDGEQLYNCLNQAEDMDSDMRGLLFNTLAKQGYKPEQISTDIILQLESGQYGGNELYRLQSALGNLQTKQAYQFLKASNSEFDLSFGQSYFSQLVKYKQSDDIKQILRQVVNNLEQDFQKRSLFISLSELFYGREFFNYLSSRLGYTGQYAETISYLEHYWSTNQGVERFIDSLAQSIKTADVEQQGAEIIDYLYQDICQELAAKYEFIELTEANLTPGLFASHRSELTEEDFWLGLMLSIIGANKQTIIQQGEEEFFIYFLTAMSIVLQEGINFKQAVSKAKQDDDYLWTVFSLDREELPAEINELIIERIDKFEEQIISLLAEDKYSSRVERILEVLAAVNAQQAVPEIIELIDKNQSDIICEQAQAALEKIEGVSLELLVHSIKDGDFTRVIYLTSLLEWYPYEFAANFLISFWRASDKLPAETFVYALKNIGSESGLEYLEENCPVERKHLYETVFILSVVNDKKRKSSKYKQQLRKFKTDELSDFKLVTDLANPNGDEYRRDENGALVRKQQKVGRNDPCPCGSDKKYKKCCGRRG